MSRYEDRYPEEKNIVEEEEVPLTKEKQVVQEASSSRSSSPTKKVWKVKAKSESIPTHKATSSEAPANAPLEKRANMTSPVRRT